MRARDPDREGYVDHHGVKLGFEVFGDGEPTLLLMPTWTVIRSRYWKAQVPYLSRDFRVVTYDGPGNGRSDRPLDPAPYGVERQGAAALAEATGGRLAVLEGGGHIPQARDPVKVNLLLREFVESLRGRAT
jgi:pimeloyl-ACP methyl ester carboxylesterase